MTFDDFKTYVFVGILTFLAGGGTAILIDYMKSPRQLTPDEIVAIVQQAQERSPYMIDKPQIDYKLSLLNENLSKAQGRAEIQIDSINSKLYELTILYQQIKARIDVESDSKKKEGDFPQ